MKHIGYIRDFVFLLIVIYFAQGSLYREGSLISQGVLFMILAISLFYFFKCLFSPDKKPLFFKVWTALFLLNAIGYFFTGDYLNPIYFNMFKSVAIALMPFYPFYYFANKGFLKSKHLLRLLVLMIPVAIYAFYFEKAMLLSHDLSVLVNNSAYLFVYLMPYLFLWKQRKTLSLFGMFLFLFFIIQANKRGALITGAIGFVFFIYFHLRTVKAKKKYFQYIFVLLGIAFLFYTAYHFFQSNEAFVSRIQSMEDGKWSGRETIYLNIFNAWYNNDNFFHLILGFGFAGSSGLSGTGNYAHNDWLELLADFGILGVIVYLVLFIAVVKTITGNNWTIEKKTLLSVVASIWFASTLFSMHYSSSASVFQGIMLAYLIGNKSKIID